MSQALNGIRVIEVGDESAVMAGRILADLGAEVVLVEPPGGGRYRRLAPYLDGAPEGESSMVHQYFNANKRSAVLDTSTSQGLDRLRSLVASADVLLSSGPADALDSLGLDAETLAALQPRLITASISPFGLDGEWRDRQANDLVAGAAGGLIWLSGERGGPPWHGSGKPAFTMASLAAATGVMLSLTQLEADPDLAGPHLDISLQEAVSMAAMQTATPTAWTWGERIPGRPGLSNALRCADGGYVGLLVRPDKFEGFLAWCDAVDIDHGMTMDDWEWARVGAPRKDNPVAAATLALAQKLSRDEFASGALEADIVCLPVLTFDDLATHEQFLVNEQFLEVEHPGLDRTLGFVRSPVDAMADGIEIAPAPLLGEATDEIVATLASAAPLDVSHDSGGAASQSSDGGGVATDDSRMGEAPGVDVSRAGSGESPSDDDQATRRRSGLDRRSGVVPEKLLDGIRVIDFGWVLAAPIGTRILASFGAEVIRVESSSKPDSMRSQPGPDGRPDENLGGLFNSVNAGKLSLTVDVSTPDGKKLLDDLISTADVVVNNFRPGAMDRMGFGYDHLRSLKDDIVLLNLPGAHRKGPWSVRSSMGNILMAASGFNMLMGFPEKRPRGVGVAYPDFTSPYLLVTTILAALRQRRMTGAGQELHLAQLSGVVSLLGVEWMQYIETGVQPPQSRNRDPNWCPHGIYPTLGDDEWVAIAVEDDAGWAQLCEVMNEPYLATDPRFATAVDRRANEDALDAAISEWTRQHDRWDLADRCQAADVAAAAVEHLVDTYERDPQLRDHYQIVQQPIAPDVDIPIDREAIRFVGAEHVLKRAPMLGEHNEHVVRDLAGYDEERYVQLLVDGILS